MGDRSEEIKRLRGCINDLVSLLALPAMWSGSDPPQVAGALLDVLFRLLRLDFAYAWLKRPAGGSPIEALRVAESRKRDPQPQEIGRTLEPWLTPDTPTSTRVVPNPVGEGEVTIAHFWLGLEKEIGVVVAGSRRAGFPTETETLLLKVAVNQAVIELQQALARTERKRAEESLRESEERFRNMADHAPVIVWVTNQDASCAFLSQSWYDFTGQTPETSFGSGWLGAVHPDDRQRIYDTFLAASERHEVFRFDYRLRDKDGEYRWVIDSAVPRFDSLGEFLGHIGSVMDITERKQAEQALQHAHELLEQRVIERTAELAAVNEDLGKEITERQHAEEALQKAFDEIKTLKDQLHAENVYLRAEIEIEQQWGEIVGQSPALKKALKLVEQVAPTTACVLIQGETGTGKELIARAIHRLSDRREQAFVKLNCAAIPTGLLEAELFGHEKGAFTGAVAQRIGRFELANRGTLFLDEVGEIPLELQVKLLRVLQEQEFERLGSTRTIRVDVRLVAASNRDLAQMVADREFRGDLYYRLKVFPILVPPLRERTEDIPLLVQHFTERHARQCNKRITSIGKETMTALCCYPWPGNVREMENFIERSVILSQDSQLETPLGELQAFNGKADMTTLEGIEREYIRRALEDSNWVIAGPAGAAAKLGLKRTSLQYKMQKLGITRPN